MAAFFLSMFMWLLNRPLIFIGLIVAVLSGPYFVGHLVGSSKATTEAELRGAKITIQRLKERGLINEAISNEPDCDLILELNPDSVCERNG